MALDFSRLLPPEVAARLERSRIRVERLYALPDRWLGREIAGMARRVRASVPELASPAAEGDGYSKHMLWDVVPEIARRLGEPLLPNESADVGLRTAGEIELRRDVSTIMSNVSSVRLMQLVPEDLQDDLHMLLLDAVNGNPVAVALDRVAPPGPMPTTGSPAMSARCPETAGTNRPPPGTPLCNVPPNPRRTRPPPPVLTCIPLLPRTPNAGYVRRERCVPPE